MTHERLSSSYGFRRNSIGASFLHTLLIVLIVVLMAGAGYFYFKSTNNFLKGSEYQAVFLDNDQVYFGKVIKNGSKVVELTDVYYLQVNSSSLLLNDEKKEDSFSLVKLGSELHGPQDTMFIYRDHILFIENLKDDSRVVSAILEHQGR